VGAYPREPYDVELLPNGSAIRKPAIQAGHDQANAALEAELDRRLAASPTKEVVLYVHGFNETFASAADTMAELCHFLGREPVCVFFTWPSSHTGNFLISYTNTTESAAYAVNHLKKTIRRIATRPGVERVHVLAHSRGTAVALDALSQLLLESIAAGQEPVNSLKLGELVLLSPDIDMDIAGERITAYLSDPDLISVWPERRLPRSLKGRLTIYASPEDRALLVSKILFRSRYRLGELTAADMKPEAQRFLAKIGKIDLISYKGKRTDLFGHSYFTTNPEVSSDLIELIRYGKRLGEPGRDLVRTGPITWEFPTKETPAAKGDNPG
jgi:esterase/lipase superfamily enzyme